MFGGWIIVGLAGWNHFFWWLNPMFDLWNPISMAKSCYTSLLMTIRLHCLVMNHAQVEQVTVNHVKSVGEIQIFHGLNPNGELVSRTVSLFMGYTPTIKHSTKIPSTNHFLGNSMSIKRPIHGPTYVSMSIPKAKIHVLSWRCEYLVEWRDHYPLVTNIVMEHLPLFIDKSHY